MHQNRSGMVPENFIRIEKEDALAIPLSSFARGKNYFRGMCFLLSGRYFF